MHLNVTYRYDSRIMMSKDKRKQTINTDFYSSLGRELLIKNLKQ